MTRLGARQLSRLRALAGGYAQVVACPITRSLAARGLLAEAQQGGLVHITPAGLRALADAAERGQIELAPNLEAIKARGEGEAP